MGYVIYSLGSYEMITVGIEVMKRAGKFGVDDPTNAYYGTFVSLRTAKRRFKEAIEKIKNQETK
jgi:hypothetical protein